MKGRTRIETIGIILFCALMPTVAIQLLVSYWNPYVKDYALIMSSNVTLSVKIESGRSLAAGPSDADELHIIPLVFVGIASKYLEL